MTTPSDQTEALLQATDGLAATIATILRKYGGTMKGRGDHDIYDALVRYKAALSDSRPTPAPSVEALGVAALEPLRPSEPAAITDETVAPVSIPIEDTATGAGVPLAGVDLAGSPLAVGGVATGHPDTSYPSVSGRYTAPSVEADAAWDGQWRTKTSVRDGSPTGRFVVDWTEAEAAIRGAAPLEALVPNMHPDDGHAYFGCEGYACRLLRSMANPAPTALRESPADNWIVRVRARVALRESPENGEGET